MTLLRLLRIPGRRQAAAIVLALSLVVVIPAAQAATGHGKARPRPAGKSDGTTFASGAVESAGAGYLVVRDHRYDIRRASVVFPGGKPAPASAAGRGSRVSLAIRGGQVVEVVVFDPNGLQ